jgi:hypothetical protein
MQMAMVAHTVGSGGVCVWQESGVRGLVLCQRVWQESGFSHHEDVYTFNLLFNFAGSYYANVQQNCSALVQNVAMDTDI